MLTKNSLNLKQIVFGSKNYELIKLAKKNSRKTQKIKMSFLNQKIEMGLKLSTYLVIKNF